MDIEKIKNENIELLSKYEPKNVLNFFANICNIPHGSKNEMTIVEYIKNVLTPVCKEVRITDGGNIYAYKGPTDGYENKKMVCLQGHCDMVCNKEISSTHDFFKDPLKLKIEDGWIKASGTTLGADNGIGVAYILDVFTNPKIQHGPIEALITVSEEISLVGISQFPSNVLKSNYLINLDNEDSHSFCIGCMGGYEFEFISQFNRTPIEEFNQKMTICIDGGASGHSGSDITLKKVNAIKLMFELLTIVRNRYTYSLVDVEGGVAKNVIPPKCVVNIAINPNDYCGIKNILEKEFRNIKKEFIEHENNLTISISKCILDVNPIDQSYSNRIINCWNSAFNGIYFLNEAYSVCGGSCNFGVLSTVGNSFHSRFFARSLYKSAKYRIKNSICSAFYDTNSKFIKINEYPQWTPIDSKNILQDHFVSIHKKICGSEPKLTISPGGLEVGVLLSKYPEMIALNIGATIIDCHTPKEKTLLKDILITYNILLELLKSID